MANVCDLKVLLSFPVLKAARRYSGIGEEHPVVGVTSIYLQ